MNKYYIRLIKKTKLINFWTFSGTELKIIFSFNYKFVTGFYKNNSFFDYNNFISMTKKIFPIFNSIISNNANILFTGSKSFYIQSFFPLKSKLITKLAKQNIGSFTNFVIEGFKQFDNIKLKKNSSLIFFFNTSNNTLLKESKAKKMPSIGFHNLEKNCLLDFPIYLNLFYFYNVYFFTRLIFKYVIRLL